MKLATRMWLLGAALPGLLLVLVFAATGQLFRYSLERSLDQALLAQAAVESVSLFDGPRGEPHLHMSSSPLVEQVRPFAPSGELFGPDGQLVVRYPPPQTADEQDVRLMPGEALDEPVLSTRKARGGERLRDVTVTVRAPSGERYVLRLTASLAQVDRSVRTFHTVAFGFAAIAVALLLALHAIQAGWLARRLNALTGHIARMRQGALDEPPPADSGRDEIASLRDALADATCRLSQARKAQERLIADAAHELRTPLTVMRTGMDLALRRERTAEELREVVRDARAEVERLATLAGNLLDLAAVGQGGWDRRPANLARVVEESAEHLRAQAEEKSVLIQVRAPSSAEAEIHAPSVRQAVDNLLANAVKFSPRGGEIRVDLARDGARWVLRVEDDGPGIPVEHREAVFAPFNRAPGSNGPGAGLGLAIVREVAERHAGRVRAEAGGSGGARLVFELPLAAEGELDARPLAAHGRRS